VRASSGSSRIRLPGRNARAMAIISACAESRRTACADRLRSRSVVMPTMVRQTRPPDAGAARVISCRCTRRDVGEPARDRQHRIERVLALCSTTAILPTTARRAQGRPRQAAESTDDGGRVVEHLAPVMMPGGAEQRWPHRPGGRDAPLSPPAEHSPGAEHQPQRPITACTAHHRALVHAPGRGSPAAARRWLCGLGKECVKGSGFCPVRGEAEREACRRSRLATFVAE